MRFPSRRLAGLGTAAALLALLPAAAAARAIEAQYDRLLLTLCDALVATQITDPASADCGALVCPSTNPQVHPLHSRAAEAVYPFAIAWRRTHDPRYRDAAVKLARWLIGKQQPRGAWGEAWPNFDGWAGTTADQLISLAGAYPFLRNELTPADQTAWEGAIRRAAAYIVQAFPVGNINYHPTGAVALLLAAEAVRDPVPAWLAKADALVALTFRAVNADGLLTGEGQGVDLGYNLAQSIGFLALYGILKSDESIQERAAALLRTHASFVYPNGAVDNSWGTRSYKWTYESGTKTAPGVYFTFALLADRDPDFGAAEQSCLDYLTTHALHDGLVTTGPHADQHASLTPPCLYSTFARAQSIAMALTYAPGRAARGPAVRQKNWHRFFPSVGVTVLRTDHLMATVSAYGAIDRYGRGQVSRGGSITNLWLEGFGATGFAQSSSVSVYRREEDIHMPDESALQPLTPRAECTIDGVYYTTLFEAEGRMSVTEEPGAVVVTTEGRLRSSTGAAAGVTYRLTHRFFGDHVTKEWTFVSPHPQVIRLVEPFVRDPDLVVAQTAPQRVRLGFGGDKAWAFAVERAPTGNTLTCNEDATPYWSPFPGVNGRPVIVTLTTTPGQPTTVETSFGPDPVSRKP
ncbi:hypothetical protein [Opitutus sp. GAS368]|uniref:hypothetical protein n=1 Tax=Opitutus sp. GAS368 TaxID=1882749 RepID=UPI00087D9ACA|nr:hypothetical protein [Opitutus sp. GAS368]SDR67806.1 hypothetical protein SAMN05444173_0352 [Opitutus sp. GAS368]